MKEEGFERVVSDHKDALYGYARSILRDSGEAQDVVQEAMVRLWNHLRVVEAAAAPAWLRRTVHNLAIDRLRWRRARPEAALESLEAVRPASAPDPERLAESGQLARAIERSLGELTVADRAVLVLREIQGLSYSEIAAVLELPMGTLKARLHRAREHLRDRLLHAGVRP